MFEYSCIQSLEHKCEECNTSQASSVQKLLGPFAQAVQRIIITEDVRLVAQFPEAQESQMDPFPSLKRS